MSAKQVHVRRVAGRRFERTPRRHPLRRILASATTLTALSVAGAVVGNGASAAVAHRTPLQKGLAFYQGKALTFIAPTSVGTPNDLSSRAIALEMGQYLHATITVENISTGGSITGQDDIAHANPNGLTIGFFNLGADYYSILTHQPGLNFNPQREVFMGGHPNTLSEIVTSTPTTFPTFASLLSATATNPIKVLEVAGTSTAAAVLLSKMFGIHSQFIVYANTGSLILGFNRGDSNFIDTDYTNFTAQINSGAYRDLVNLTTVPVRQAEPGHAELVGAPTVTQLLKKYPPKTRAERKDATYFTILQSVPLNTLGAPSAVPSDEVAALDAAAKYAYSSAYVTAAIVNAASVPGFIPPTTEKLAYTNALKSEAAISAALGY